MVEGRGKEVELGVGGGGVEGGKGLSRLAYLIRFQIVYDACKSAYSCCPGGGVRGGG